MRIKCQQMIVRQKLAIAADKQESKNEIYRIDILGKVVYCV
jgi:hypothetical protein